MTDIGRDLKNSLPMHPLTLSQDQAVKILGLVSRIFVVLITRLSFAAPNP